VDIKYSFQLAKCPVGTPRESKKGERVVLVFSNSSVIAVFPGRGLVNTFDPMAVWKVNKATVVWIICLIVRRLWEKAFPTESESLWENQLSDVKILPILKNPWTKLVAKSFFGF